MPIAAENGGFAGIMPAIVTPMDASGDVNYAAFAQVMEYNIQAGVHGFWIAGGTGESIMIDDAENMRMAEIAAEVNKGRVTNIMHVGAATTKRACALAEHAAKVGMESICAVPPFFYKPSTEALVAHVRAIPASPMPGLAMRVLTVQLVSVSCLSPVSCHRRGIGRPAAVRLQPAVLDWHHPHPGPDETDSRGCALAEGAEALRLRLAGGSRVRIRWHGLDLLHRQRSALPAGHDHGRTGLH